MVSFLPCCFKKFYQYQYENCVPGRETTVSDVCLCICSDLRIGIKMLSMILVLFFDRFFLWSRKL